MASAAKSVTGVIQCREYVAGRQLDIHSQPDEVQVWTIDLNANRASVPHFRSLLPAEEIARADKFRFEQGRNEFTITRGVLRILLGAYLGIGPEQLQFSYSGHGKPELDGELKHSVEFNVSHSDGIAIVSFACGRRLGVDVEKIRHDFEQQKIAERFFSENEREQLRNIPRSELSNAFFRCWTRKEAFIKALGEGLSHPLHQFDVELRAGKCPSLLNTRPDSAEALRWSLFDIPVPAGYVAALAMEDSSRLA